MTLTRPLPIEDDERPDWMGPPQSELPPRPPEPPEVEDGPDFWTPPGGSYRNVTWLPNWRPVSHF